MNESNEINEEPVLCSNLNGKPILYSPITQFYVQVGRYRGAYTTRYTITGNLERAVKYFRCINIGNGYKKRLMMEDLKLATAYSY